MPSNSKYSFKILFLTAKNSNLTATVTEFPKKALEENAFLNI